MTRFPDTVGMSLEIEVLFEDADLLVVNKPSGVLSEGGRGEPDLESWASEQYGKPVSCCHRLDKLTSGAVLLRKNKRFNRQIAQMMERHRFRKSYWAVTLGIWPKSLTKIENHLLSAPGKITEVTEHKGQIAKTSFRVLAHDQEHNRTWLQLLLKTGRTHQARVHCSHARFPIWGDPLYGRGDSQEFFGLHARELKFRHPGTEAEITAIAPPPASWDTVLGEFERKKS